MALSQLAPGSLVAQLTIYIGFVHYGLLGACVTPLATFLPCFLFTIILAPHFKKIVQNKSIKAFVDGITAAVVGALVGAVIVIATRSIADIPTVLIAIGTILILIYTKKYMSQTLLVLQQF